MWSDEEEEVSKSAEVDHSAHSADEHAKHVGHDHVDTMRSVSANNTNNSTNNTTNTQQSDVAKFGATGTNVSGHNETCTSSSGRVCNTERNLVCSANSVCLCKEGFTYVPQQERCMNADIRGVDINFQCQYDQQCQDGKRGKLSRCSGGKCECYDHQSSGRKETKRVDGVCYLIRTHGDVCETHHECNATIAGEASCNLPTNGSSTEYRYCQCDATHVWDTLIKECLLIPKADKALNHVCKSKLQCVLSSLGNYSTCHREDAKCVCNNPATPGPEHVVHYQNICFPRRNLNDTCTTDQECHASLGKWSFCGEHDAYIMEKVCQCPPGKVCKGGASGLLAMGPVATIFLVVASVVLGRFQSVQ